MNHKIMSHDRYQPCAWYAWGQQDAGIGVGLDVFEFATQHVMLALSAPTFLPSIQDAWKQYVAAAAMAQAEERLAAHDARITVNSFLDGLLAGGGTNMVDERDTAFAPIDDEVVSFLAKAIDEAQP